MELLLNHKKKSHYCETFEILSVFVILTTLLDQLLTNGL
jgi:hypothetical protein